VLLLLAIAAAPVILGTLSFYFFPPSGRVNYGRLVKPVPFVLAARLDDGQVLGPALLADRWWLVTVDASACAEACLRKLLLMRQLRLAQGKDQDRVGRLWVLTDAGPVGTVPVSLTEGLRTARIVDPRALGQQFGDENPIQYIYLVDPFGRLMMSFPSDPDPGRMLKDLQRLLSVNSWERVSHYH
jgi:hypothetical protein